MKKRASLSAAVVATLVLVAYVLGSSATSARTQDSLLMPIFGRNWPPNASDMVVIDGSFTMKPNSFHKVYTVPANRWFVLTDIQFDAPGYHDLVQRLKQKEQVRIGFVIMGLNRSLPLTLDVGSHRVGISFFPGSEIGFRQQRTLNPRPAFYHLRGYLTNR